MENSNIKFGTKFLLVGIINFIISFTEGLLINPAFLNSPVFNILSGCFVAIFMLSYYSLFVATIWQILEEHKFYNVKKLPIIAVACIFGTVVNNIMFINLPNKTPLIYTYIFTAIEILSICIFEQLISNMKKSAKQICKIANFCDKTIITYIYLIVFTCFLSWLPGLNWEFLPLKVLWHIVGPYMVLFENFIPRIVGIDFSPILAIALLLFAKKCLDIYFSNVILTLSREEVKEESEEEKQEETDDNSDENND